VYNPGSKTNTKYKPKHNRRLIKFIIDEDHDNHDYVLSVEELAEYKGNKFHDKRNLVNKFNRLYPNYTIKLLDLNDEEQKIK